METTPQGITIERSGRAVAVHWRVESAVLVASAPVAAWVAPTSAASSGVAVVSDSEAEGVVLESLDVWQLGTPEITTLDM